MTVTNRTVTSNTTLNDPKDVLNLAREGTVSQAYGARATFKLSRYENSGTDSRTRLDLNLAHGSYDDQNIMTMRSDGRVGIGTTSPGSTLEVHGTGIHIEGTVLRSSSSMGPITAGTWYRVCDFSALPTTAYGEEGVCVIHIGWGDIDSQYWAGHASGIVPYNTKNDGNGQYTSAPSEPLTLTHYYHHRGPAAFQFILDGDGSGGSYGYQSVYIKSPNTLTNLVLTVRAIPLRR